MNEITDFKNFNQFYIENAIPHEATMNGTAIPEVFVPFEDQKNYNFPVEGRILPLTAKTGKYNTCNPMNFVPLSNEKSQY